MHPPPDEKAPTESHSFRAIVQPEERYSYLLRLWRNGPNGGWRASLQSVQTGEQHMFADLESLLAFLVEQSSTPQR